ncbi:MAG: hypothetical protein RL094_11 [Candidatus Parcubacteria bacterium]|jgi:single-strand DNA-binding protein
MYLNKAIIYGNITRDPELKALPSGIQVVSFSVATNRVWKDQSGAKQENVDYHNIVVFGRQAEIAAQYLKKGSGVFVEGRMQTRSWDGQDGKKQYRTEVVADKIQFGPRPGGAGAAGGYSQPQADAPSKPAKKASNDEESGGGESFDYPLEDINPEEIPF